LRAALKHIVAHTYKPFLVRYLAKTRTYQQNGIRLEVPPDVFHPGFFYSTQLLNRYLDRLPVKEKTFLELGAGSGFISFNAATRGAIVTASDINSVAIEYLKKNSVENKITIDIIHSDLFANVPMMPFDIIAINPPYYKKTPLTLLDHAWFCGEQGEYFARLFAQITDFMHLNTETIMVLCEGCDVEMIRAFARENGFILKLMLVKQSMLEKNFIYKIEKIV
jgi:release factor glutamine methyltransferase